VKEQKMYRADKMKKLAEETHSVASDEIGIIHLG
jgi:hypothetical protein